MCSCVVHDSVKAMSHKTIRNNDFQRNNVALKVGAV